MNYNIVNNKVTGDQLTAQEWNEAANALLHLISICCAVDDSTNILTTPLGNRYLLTPYQEEYSTFGEISITLNYTKIPNTGGTATPTLAYTQVETVHHSDGSTSTITHNSEGNVSYVLQDGLTGASINDTTGVVTYNVPNNTESEITVGKVTVTVSMNNKTATKQVSVKQAATIPDNILRYGQIEITEEQLLAILGGTLDMDSLLTNSIVSSFEELVNYKLDDNNPSTQNDEYSYTFDTTTSTYSVIVFMLSNNNHRMEYLDPFGNKGDIIEFSDFKEMYPNTCIKESSYNYNSKQYYTVSLVTNTNEDKVCVFQIKNNN